MLVIVVALAVSPLATMAYDYLPIDDDAFWWTWARTDYPVEQGVESRTWMWGPGAYTTGGYEFYYDSPGEERFVQYFDKSRMEINNPFGNPNDPWYVTNGRLAWELMSGYIQVGDHDYWEYFPSYIQVAGDGGWEESPTYADFGELMYVGQYEVGQMIDIELVPWWEFEDEYALEVEFDYTDYFYLVPDYDYFQQFQVTAAVRESTTGMTIASPFWNFMNSMGTVYDEYGYYQDYLFESPYYATGLPLTEAYWMWIPVAGEWQYVLGQCFERRCLSYTPGNQPAWRVEAGNIGQHYFHWRYDD